MIAGRRSFVGFALAAPVAASAAAWPAPVACVALALALLVAPGALLADGLWPDEHETRWAAALVLSPFLAGAPFALLRLAGLPAADAARAVTLAFGLACAWRATRQGRGRALPEAGVLVIAAAWAALVIALYVATPALAPRSDGTFHAALTLQVLARGVPPEDPFWAGLRVLYFWGEHAWAAMWLALAPARSVWTPWIAAGAAGAVAVVLAVAALARRLGGDAVAQRAAAACALLGYAPFAWLQVAARVASGEVRGTAELTRLAGHGPDRVLQTLATGQLHASMAFFGDKFLVLTPFALGLPLFVLGVRELLVLGDAPSRRGAVALAVVLAAALWTHTVVGEVLLALAALGIASEVVRAGRGDARARAACAHVTAAAAAATLLLLPYLLEISLGKHDALAWRPRAEAARTLALAGALYVVAGGAWLARRRQEPPARRLALWAVMLALAGMALKLPENNQTKFFNLLFLVLAAPAGLQLSAWFGRWTAPAQLFASGLLVAAIVPTFVLVVWGFATARGWDGHAGTERPARRSALAWIRAHTPPDAAFCDAEARLLPELQAEAGRSSVWSGARGERDWGYAPAALAARRSLAHELAGGDTLGGDSRALLAALARPVFVVRSARDSRPAWATAAAQPAFANDSLALWRVEEAR